MKSFKKKYIKIAVYILLALVIAFFLLYNLTSIPSSLFCDETEIALVTKQMLNGDFSKFIDPFYYNHFNYILPTLILYLQAPFIAIFGVTEFAVRLCSTFYSAMSLITLWFIFRELKWGFKPLAILFFFFTPLFFHLSRTSFGYTQTFFIFLVGLLFLIKARKKPNAKNQSLAGAFIGLSLYGQQASYQIAIPVFVFIMMLAFVCIDIKDKVKFKKLFFSKAIFAITILITLIPIFYQIKTNPSFFNRFNDKSKENHVQTFDGQVERIKNNISKYYTFDYLFIKGENEIPHSFITRHSIAGLGILNPIIILFCMFGVASICLVKEGRPVYIVSLICASIFPIVDILTTDENKAPYTLSATLLLISLPFVIGYPVHAISKIINKWPRRILVGFLLIYISAYSIYFFSAFNNYKSKSSDYWGFQEGMKQIVFTASSLEVEYDDIYITGYYNQPESLLSFYNYDKSCKKCAIGGIERYNKTRKQLFFVRKDELNTITKNHLNYIINTKGYISISNGQNEYIYFEIKTND